MDPDKLFEYVISERAENNVDIEMNEEGVRRAKNAISNTLTLTFKNLKNKLKDFFTRPFRAPTGGKSIKYKKHKKNTIRRK
jgi:hypothetical protein